MKIITCNGAHRLFSGLFHLNISADDSNALAFVGVKRDNVPQNFWDLLGRTTVEAQNINVAAFYAQGIWNQVKPA